ncbi:MAG: cytochrome b5 [Bacteroidetes bacterium]|jgi:predicted heme/steroid binding protein|nr:cytochrome b5 [Bacteroidota bacterium]
MDLCELPEIGLRTLSLHNGQDRDKVWVAFKGLIYDVTGSRLWAQGKHYAHWAGQDLTQELAQAPHGEHVFGRWPVVGRLVG